MRRRWTGKRTLYLTDLIISDTFEISLLICVKQNYDLLPWVVPFRLTLGSECSLTTDKFGYTPAIRLLHIWWHCNSIVVWTLAVLWECLVSTGILCQNMDEITLSLQESFFLLQTKKNNIFMNLLNILIFSHPFLLFNITTILYICRR